MSRWARGWSIRTRTALTFALAAMALATGVVLFTNTMSLAGVGAGLDTAAVQRPPSGSPGTTTAPAPIEVDGTADDGAVAVIRLVAVQQWQWSAIGIAGAGLAAGGIGWLVSRRVLRPIDRITATTNRISASNLHERIALDGPDDELRRLSRTVDDLLERLETAFESQRRFVAQASHELRTPLAVQRAAVQIGLHDDADPADVRAVRAELLEQNRRTERLVESLLVLAEADRGLAGATRAVDLDEVTAEVVAGAARDAAEAGVTLTHERRTGPPGLVVPGEPTLLRQLLGNLVGNAVEYNEPGGVVLVTTEPDGFVVENGGPVVPADEAGLLVEPFRRGGTDDARGQHSGLGLSIVAAIVHAHGWRLSIAARPTGGLLVRVRVSPVQPDVHAGRNSRSGVLEA
ncbi:sensor histidine kinase [Curtobacterium flaccumfaciens]|uniref:sensor histidine kinase n=1 Tax=Curtobacterium flaccumfaciens TaxID=2035 RepID=UPI001BDF1001|nr:HAMP domain-containing sensor histidine kinase [Curtobacterium flaccumfaciens]MBT1607615.1 HAMP domain-containing histidine kinase [Curtobacterium flaccumfaciens pv. betae]MBT1655768.1 HAMP domain-containing histidine kinase [Curtobacterium flaccumfaciens pv. betae]MCS0471536.1 HAMP domain-containing histidine kinase [Curtobacterium flaccumfaciens pv. betae]MCS0473291.1 HAMP domain-containing histidine kinase [Curtobacterium flaccumfaciens pv. betae]MCS0478020.1 HAMP domain-containing histi